MNVMDIVLCLGSNVTDCDERLIRAVESLSLLLDDMRMSRRYYTPAEFSGAPPPDSGSHPPYLNQVIAATFRGSYDDLHRRTKSIEALCGRRRDHGAEVAVDIDIVIADGQVMRPRDYNAEHFRIGYRELGANV